jgi:hypothetical protein
VDQRVLGVEVALGGGQQPVDRLVVLLLGGRRDQRLAPPLASTYITRSPSISSIPGASNRPLSGPKLVIERTTRSATASTSSRPRRSLAAALRCHWRIASSVRWRMAASLAGSTRWSSIQRSTVARIWS